MDTDPTKEGTNVHSEGGGRMRVRCEQQQGSRRSTHWSLVCSFCSTPTKPSAEGFTLSRAGNRAPDECLQNTVRVAFSFV